MVDIDYSYTLSSLDVSLVASYTCLRYGIEDIAVSNLSEFSGSCWELSCEKDT